MCFLFRISGWCGIKETIDAFVPQKYILNWTVKVCFIMMYPKIETDRQCGNNNSSRYQIILNCEINISYSLLDVCNFQNKSINSTADPSREYVTQNLSWCTQTFSTPMIWRQSYRGWDTRQMSIYVYNILELYFYMLYLLWGSSLLNEYTTVLIPKVCYGISNGSCQQLLYIFSALGRETALGWLLILKRYAW